MFQFVGHVQPVKKVLGDKAVFERAGKQWAFNVKSLQVVAKNSELKATRHS